MSTFKSGTQESATGADATKPMSLEEARSVLWFRSYNRPIGELLDEGRINQDRLEWAAQNAYDPRIKQASIVILNWMKQARLTLQEEKPPTPQHQATQVPAVQVGMTVEQARRTLWPFGGFKGQPMGTLVDSRQLTLKDLAYAVENAWDEQVRRAAILMMAVRLNQAVKEPAPSAGPLRILSGGRSFAERRQLFLSLIQGSILGAVCMLLLVFMVQSIAASLTSRPSKSLTEILATPVNVVFLLVFIALVVGILWSIGRLLDWTMNRLDKQIDNYRKGQEGEEQVVEAMRQSLDGNWTLFRNVNLPGRNKADIDGVLVGPSGVWALEVKMFSGEYRNIGEHWECRAGNKWIMLRKSPSRQVQDSAVRLANFFKADGIKQWVTPAVVWANRANPLTVENPSVAVWRIDQLPEELGNIWQGRTVPELDRARIITKLTTLCEKPVESG
jgi:hypothetical protein